MTDLPVWIQLLQALLTPAVAIAVGGVAFMQWRTAHNKSVLDLFDKRIEVYASAKNAVGMVLTQGKCSPDSEKKIMDAIDRSTFLFGTEVKFYLMSIWTEFIRLNSLNEEIKSGVVSSAKKRVETFGMIQRFYRDAPDVFGPYMRMDHKIALSPIDFLREKNRIRLSYADEKQR